MKTIKSAVLLLALIVTLEAHALVLVEPHLGYTFSGTGQSEAVPATMIKHNGGQYGIKLGANIVNAMAGIDYNRSNFEQLTSGYKNGFARSELGIFVGYNFPGVVRTWLTYFFKNTQTAETDSPLIANGSEYKGRTVELGVGYNGFHQYLSVNLHYRVITQDKFISNGTTTSLSGSDEISSKEIVLGVSSPINLF